MINFDDFGKVRILDSKAFDDSQRLSETAKEFVSS